MKRVTFQSSSYKLAVYEESHISVAVYEESHISVAVYEESHFSSSYKLAVYEESHISVVLSLCIQHYGYMEMNACLICSRYLQLLKLECQNDLSPFYFQIAPSQYFHTRHS